MSPVVIVTALFFVAMVVIGWRLWTGRRRPAYTTRQGVKVFAAPSGFVPDREENERAIDAALATFPADLSGCNLTFVDTQTVHYAGRPSNMGGAAVPGAAVVVAHDARRFAYVAHEMAHLCLFRRGVPDADHHGVFVAAGYPYA